MTGRNQTEYLRVDYMVSSMEMGQELLNQNLADTESDKNYVMNQTNSTLESYSTRVKMLKNANALAAFRLEKLEGLIT